MQIKQKDQVFHFKIFCVHERITNGGIELFVFWFRLFVFQNPNKNTSNLYTSNFETDWRKWAWRGQSGDQLQRYLGNDL